MICALLIDNQENYDLRMEEQKILAGLCRATGILINSHQQTILVKFCWPAEIFMELSKTVFTADKDFHVRQYLHWNAEDLMHIAAHRMRVFLAIYHPEEYNNIKDMRLHERPVLRQFWQRYLPRTITNNFDLEEDSFIYILRHTQMLPRQLLQILNDIARKCSSWPCKDEKELEAAVIGGVMDAEEHNKEGALTLFRSVYTEIDNVLDLTLTRLPPTFSYGDLQRVWNETARPIMHKMQRSEFWEFWRLLLSAGCVGLVDRDGTTDRYTIGQFEFNVAHTLKISEKDQLCIHPMFSRIYNVKRPSDDRRAILPRGAEFWAEDEQNGRDT